MKERRVDFDHLPWEKTVPGMRIKAMVRGGKRLRLVELTGDFAEPEGCVGGHIGYILEGNLEVAFPESTESFSAGDGIFILGGEAERHRARVPDGVARLVLVDEVRE